MTTFPSISGKVARRAFERAGWIFKRQKGSHMILSKPGVRSILTIPNHKTIKMPLLKRIIKDSDITEKKFLNLLKSS